MAKLIDGKAISAQIRVELREETEKLVKETGVRPGLAVIIVGCDPASQVYVRNKRKACEEVGYYSEAYELPEATTQEELPPTREACGRLTRRQGFPSSKNQ